ncbi:hypothetical protein [Kitasatospora sp. NPDC059599]
MLVDSVSKDRHEHGTNSRRRLHKVRLNEDMIIEASDRRSFLVYSDRL